jgi:hypothetical protein
VVGCTEAGVDEALVLSPSGAGHLARDRWVEYEYGDWARKEERL